MRIIFTGGGTGGHIFPIVAIARELVKLRGTKSLKLFYIGPKDDFCRVILVKEGIKVKSIATGKIRRYLNPLALIQNAIDIVVNIPLGIIQAFIGLVEINPNLVFSKGGYGSFPVTISARLLGIPIFLQESDSVPGLANSRTASYAAKVFTAFPNTESLYPYQIMVTGNPIRQEILQGSKDDAAKLFHLKGGRPVILVLGGSQGARRINDKILNELPELLAKYEIIHQVGPKNLDQTEKEIKVASPKDLEEYYHPIGFIDEKKMAHAYAAADLVISRAGAGSIFEIAAVNKPSILIPLPEAAQDHQAKNAHAYANTGAALVFEENNFTPHVFFKRVSDILGSPESIRSMTQAAQNFSRPFAAKTIAEYIIRYLTK